MLFKTSEELVRLLEEKVRTEQNESYRNQYNTLLQQQRNTSATLRSLEEVASQSVQANQYNAEMGKESHVDASAMQKATQSGTMNQTSANAGATQFGNEFGSDMSVDTKSAQRNANNKDTNK